MTLTLAVAAAKDLLVRDVMLGDHSAVLHPGAKDLPLGAPTACQYKWGVKRFDVMSVNELETGKFIERQLVIIFFGGCRLLRVNADGSLPEASSTDPEQLIGEFNSEFKATFVTVEGKELSREAVTAFARRNVPHLVWPWWREWLSSTSTSMGIPRITLPMKLPDSVEKPGGTSVKESISNEAVQSD